MDYKKLIKSRETRIKILHLLDFIPDRAMLKLQYRIKTGRKLNLKNPRRFTEKMQWYKLYYKDNRMIQCVDKYDVREYVASKGLGSILNTCYGVYDMVGQIHWDELPSRFVIKDTLGGGGNSVIIVKDKNAADKEAILRTADGWTKESEKAKNVGREWQYSSGKKHRIIVEKYIESDPEKGGLIDYKFLCFNGKPVVLLILADRTIGVDAQCGTYDISFNKMAVTESDETPLQREIEKPENYEEMLRIAEVLSEDFPCARIDLYDNDGQVTFGEVTFYDGSGYMTYSPDEFDFWLGNQLALPAKLR